jgi:hypothetical protein
MQTGGYQVRRKDGELGHLGLREKWAKVRRLYNYLGPLRRLTPDAVVAATHHDADQ